MSEEHSVTAKADGEVEQIEDNRRVFPEDYGWDDLMTLLDAHWPEDVFPTLLDRDVRDPGPRIVSLLRRLDDAGQRERRALDRAERALEREAKALDQADAAREQVARDIEAEAEMVKIHMGGGNLVSRREVVDVETAAQIARGGR